MLFRMSNQDENTSGHWLQRVYPYTICGGVLGFVLCLLFCRISNTAAGEIPFLISGATLGTAVGINGFFRGKVNYFIPLWFRQVFASGLAKILGSIFSVFFIANFFRIASLSDRYDPKIWEGILSGGWHGAVAVLMVLAGVVLWKLATKDAPKPD